MIILTEEEGRTAAAEHPTEQRLTHSWPSWHTNDTNSRQAAQKPTRDVATTLLHACASEAVSVQLYISLPLTRPRSGSDTPCWLTARHTEYGKRRATNRWQTHLLIQPGFGMLHEIGLHGPLLQGVCGAPLDHSLHHRLSVSPLTHAVCWKCYISSYTATPVMGAVSMRATYSYDSLLLLIIGE